MPAHPYRLREGPRASPDVALGPSGYGRLTEVKERVKEDHPSRVYVQPARDSYTSTFFPTQPYGDIT